MLRKLNPPVTETLLGTAETVGHHALPCGAGWLTGAPMVNRCSRAPALYSPGFAFCLASRRAAASQEFAIQVPTPSRGSTHRINAKYAAITRTICSQSGTEAPSFIISDAMRAGGDRRWGSFSLPTPACGRVFSASERWPRLARYGSTVKSVHWPAAAPLPPFRSVAITCRCSRRASCCPSVSARRTRPARCLAGR